MSEDTGAETKGDGGDATADGDDGKKLSGEADTAADTQLEGVTEKGADQGQHEQDTSTGAEVKQVREPKKERIPEMTR